MAAKGPQQSADPAARREAQREALRREREAEMRRQRRLRTLIIAGVAVVAVGVVLAILAALGVFAMLRGEDKDSGAVTAPQGVAAGQAYYSFGAESGKPVVDLYVDYMCPVCGQFHQINGSELDQMVKDKTVTVHLYVRNFLDSQSTTDYSSRAANAFAAVYAESPEKAWAFQDLLFADQPEEGGAGLTDAKLKELATQAGASEAAATAISDKTYLGWVEKVVEPAAQKSTGQYGTPYVAIDGTHFETWNTPGALADAIRSAGGGSAASDAGGASDGGS